MSLLSIKSMVDNDKNNVWASSQQEEEKIYDSLCFQREDTTGWTCAPLPILRLSLESLNLESKPTKTFWEMYSRYEERHFYSFSFSSRWMDVIDAINQGWRHRRIRRNCNRLWLCDRLRSGCVCARIASRNLQMWACGFICAFVFSLQNKINIQSQMKTYGKMPFALCP